MKGKEIISEWNAKTPEQQFTFCENCVKRAIKSGRTLKPGYDMDDAVQSTFAGVLERLADAEKLDADSKRRESQGKTPNTLAAVVCRAANNAMQHISYHSAKEGKATSQTITDDDGKELDLLDTIAAADDTEAAAIIRASLEQLRSGRDAIDQKILELVIAGYTKREIAAEVLISNVAVHKRIAKMRNDLIKAIA